MTPAPMRSSTTGGLTGQQHAGAQPDIQTPNTLTGRLDSAQPLGLAQHPELCASTIAKEHSHPTAAARPQGRLRPTMSAHEPRSAPLGAEPTRLQTTLSAITQQLSALEESLQPAAQPPRARMSQIFPAAKRQQAVPQAHVSSTPGDSRLGDSGITAAGQRRTASPRRGSQTWLPSQAGMPLAQADSRTPVMDADSNAEGDWQLQEQHWSLTCSRLHRCQQATALLAARPWGCTEAAPCCSPSPPMWVLSRVAPPEAPSSGNASMAAACAAACLP